MKYAIIILIIFVIRVTNSQEIIMNRAFKTHHDYLRNTYLLQSNNYFYITGFSETSKDESNEGITSLIKIDQNFNQIWETNDTLDNTTIPLITFENKDKKIITLSNYGSMFKYLYSQIIDTSGDIIYSTDSVSLKNNFLFNVGKYFVNFDFNIYHIYNSASDTAAKLVLQTYDEFANYVSEENIYYMDSIIYRDLEINDAMLTKDSGIVVVGDFYNKIRKKYDMYFLKFDKDKQLVWEHIMVSDSARELPAKLLETSKGKFIIIGWLRPYMKTFNRYEHFIKQFDSNGNIDWERYNFENVQIFDTKLFETPQGNYFVIANTLQSIIEEPPFTLIKFCILKIDNNGNLIWKKEWGDPGLENQLKSIVVLSDNEIVCSGYQGDNTYIARIIDTTKVNIPENILEYEYIKIFPNPTSSTINLRYRIETAGTVNIFLTDVLGNKTLLKSDFKYTGDYVETFDFGGYPQGIYNVVLQTDNQIRSEKVFILK